ncbi:VanZ family protein [Lysinibacillus sp. FSL H8-0500]|uniref:VanZ family protein n=1 Tax=Lysinibacillus sp. FSL H8-0500 TaxID=2921393 RepID=UPI003100B0C1
MIIGAVLYIIIRGIVFWVQRKSFQLKKELILFFFIVYCVGLASQTIIPKFEFGNVEFGIISNNFGFNINLIPFRVIQDTYETIFYRHYYDYFIINFLGNIIIFIPFGFFIPILFKKVNKFKEITIIGCILSVGKEIIQLLLYRSFDIDDLWLNTLGVCIGYLLCSSKTPASREDN